MTASDRGDQRAGVPGRLGMSEGGMVSRNHGAELTEARFVSTRPGTAPHAQKQSFHVSRPSSAWLNQGNAVGLGSARLEMT